MRCTLADRRYAGLQGERALQLTPPGTFAFFDSGGLPPFSPASRVRVELRRPVLA